MKYHITSSDSELYLPKIEHWIINDLKLKLNEAMLYKLILLKGYLIWNAEYIGKVLIISRSTVLRLVDRLCQLDIIEKRTKVYSNRTRWVLVGKYTENGERTESEMNKLFQDGFNKLEASILKKCRKKQL